MSSVDLIVFSDDWGRHPSSCQHLVRRLLSRHRTFWVNTIGTRLPGLSAEDLAKVAGKLRQWLSRPAEPGPQLPGNLTVMNPKMWPGFRRSWQRGLNRRLVCSAVHRALGPRQPGRQRVALTTLPITADLVGHLDVDRWVYYCVDDFSVWPGLDADVMQTMERELVRKVDAAVAVSEVLVEHLGKMGKTASLLTHGIDLGHWSPVGSLASSAESAQTEKVVQASAEGAVPLAGRLPDWFRTAPRPIILFWGLIDARLDVTWCRALLSDPRFRGQLVLVGPQQSADSSLATLSPSLRMPGAVRYDDLPALARAADVLVMPYQDMAATRAMQPLKFKEYLATGKPVVARALPATLPWADAADLVYEASDFVAAVLARAAEGLSAAQTQARYRLQQETWDHKAQALEACLQAPMVS